MTKSKTRTSESTTAAESVAEKLTAMADGNDIVARLADLRSVVSDLDAAAATVDAIVVEVETILASEFRLKDLVVEQVPDFDRSVRHHKEHPNGIMHTLCYGDFCGQHRSYIWSVSAESDGRVTDSETVPWVYAGRDLKLRAFALLPKLLDAIYEKAQARKSKSARAVTKVKAKLEKILEPKETA